MMRRLTRGAICALLLLSMLFCPGALASDEPAEAAPSEEPAGDLVPVGETADAEAFGGEYGEMSGGEAPVPAAAGELPLAAVEAYPDYDPEDPMLGRLMNRGDGAYGSRWNEFVTRELDHETLLCGIDVSAWQGSIDWSRVAADGVEFAIIRAAYRTVSAGRLAEDVRFAEYMRGAKVAGLPVGVYIFSQAITVAEAEEEADYLLELVRGYDIDLPLVFDLEHYSGGRFSGARLSRREVTDMCLAFCRRVEAAGYTAMVYSNPSMLNNDMYADEIGKLWLANFTTRTGYTGHPYEYWQCSDHGSVRGIDGDVDLDFWFRPDSYTGGTPVGQETTGPFQDVRESDWFYADVMWCYEHNIVNGMSAALFEPSGIASRGQTVTMLYRLAGSPPWTEAAAFADLEREYYRDAIFWAAQNGVVRGYSDTVFGPERPITREELVTVLYRMEGEPDTFGDLSAFSDAGTVHVWAERAMAWGVETGLVTGYEDGTLRPRLNATRAVVCAFLARYSALDG